MIRPRTFIAAAALANTLAFHPAGASAAWSESGAGPGGAAAAVMPTGATPTLRSSGDTVTVVWAAANLSSGPAVAGYVVHRYNSVNGSPATVGGTCSGVVSGTSCTETVTSGTWVYTDTPVQLTWTGGESSESSPVTAP